MLTVALVLAVISGNLLVYLAADSLNAESNNSSVANNSVLLLGQGIATPINQNAVKLVPGSCGSKLVLVTSQSSIPRFEGSPALLVYSCSNSGQVSALHTTGRIGYGRVTPSFIAPAGWSLGLVHVGLRSSCSSGSTITFTSGTPINLPAGQNYDYCLSTNDASSFSSFSILWS